MAANPASTSYGSSPDVTFVFPQNEGATISVEKSKLMEISEVFRTQFTSGFENIQLIEITDISFEVYNMFMKFIYDELMLKYWIWLKESNYQEVLYAAHKYLIYPIISDVIKFALNLISWNNVVDVYEFFDKFEIQKINEHILEVCVAHALVVIPNLTGSNIHMKLLKEILQSPIMNCSEYYLYVAIVNMMKRVIPEHVSDVAAEMRKKLGNLIYLIRFPTMPINELTRCGKPPSLLTLEELHNLLLWVEMGIYNDFVNKFSTKTRINQSTSQGTSTIRSIGSQQAKDLASKKRKTELFKSMKQNPSY